MRWSLASRSLRPSTPVSCQRVSHFGAVSGMSFCQKPGRPAPFGKRWRLSGRSSRWRQHRRGDPREVADELALGDRAAAVGIAWLEQRLVEVRQLQLVGRRPARRPSLPSASSAASSASVTRQAAGTWAVTSLPPVLRFRRTDRRFVVGAARVGLRRGLAALLACSASAARTAVVVATARLAHDGGRVAARLDPLERGLADHAVARPAAELGPDDQLRPDPGDVRAGRRPSGRGSPSVAADRTAGRRSRAGPVRASRSLRIAPVNPEPTLPLNRSLPSS